MSRFPNPSENLSNIHSMPHIELAGAYVVDKPIGVPLTHDLYNPSGIWTIPYGQPGAGLDALFLRKEQSQSDPTSSHLGKTTIDPYKIDLSSPGTPIEPFDGAMSFIGEDPYITRINRKIGLGRLQRVWLLGFVKVTPCVKYPDRVESIVTEFHAGTRLDNLEKVAEGAPGEKDVRVFQAGDPRYSTALHVYGRPQPKPFSGNVTYRMISDLSKLDARNFSNLPFIYDNLYPIGGGTWGGVNDGRQISATSNLLAMHDATRTGADGKGRDYKAVLREHNFVDGTIRDIGILATIDDFKKGRNQSLAVKADVAVDTGGVVFTGGGYNGRFDTLVTAGACDANFGIIMLKHTAQMRRLKAA